MKETNRSQLIMMLDVAIETGIRIQEYKAILEKTGKCSYCPDFVKKGYLELTTNGDEDILCYICKQPYKIII